jgi:Flp pilus assembly protein TadD
MPHRFTPWLPVLLVIALLAGCRSSGAHQQSKPMYSTLPDAAHQDAGAANAKHIRALELIDAGQLDEAEPLLREVLSADVTFGPAHNNLGKLYFEQGKFYLAAWEFEYAIKLMPHQPEPRNNLGLVLEVTQQLDEAATYYQQALDLEPGNPEILGNLIRARLSRGDHPADLRHLLRELLQKDTRPQWQKWAQDQLARAQSPTSAP